MIYNLYNRIHSTHACITIILFINNLMNRSNEVHQDDAEKLLLYQDDQPVERGKRNISLRTKYALLHT